MKLQKYDKKEVENQTYLKLAVNKAHMGPVSEEKIARAKATALTAAANKVRVMSNFTIKVNTTNDNGEKKRPGNQSFLVTGFSEVDSPEDVAKGSVLMMEAWGEIFGNHAGTKAYMEKLTRALEARATAYAKLGINPNGNSKPDLTSDQRVVYNSIVGPTGFDYYEYHLAFKLEGQKKFTRSTTYRSIDPLPVSQMLDKLSAKCTSISKKIILEVKQTN